MARAAGELGAAVDGMEKATQKILQVGRGDRRMRQGARPPTQKTDYERGLAQDIQDHVDAAFTRPAISRISPASASAR